MYILALLLTLVFKKQLAKFSSIYFRSLRLLNHSEFISQNIFAGVAEEDKSLKSMISYFFI